MPDNLKDLIDKNIGSNERVLRRSERRYDNQKLREIGWRRKLKKGLVYGGVLSILALGVYGGNYYWNKHQDYVTNQRKKIVYYQKKFNKVEYFYNRGDYMWADKLSEELQEEMSNESFFSPTNNLYDKVEEYDNRFIDPEVKKIKRERFKRKLQELPYNIRGKCDELYETIEFKWAIATSEERVGVFVGGMVLLALLCKILFGNKKCKKK